MSGFDYETYWASQSVLEFMDECLSQGEHLHPSGILYEPLSVRAASPMRCGSPALESEMNHFHCPEWHARKAKNLSRANGKKASAAGKRSGNARLLKKAQKLGLSQ